MKRMYFAGVPSGAGGNCPGMEYAPMHLRRLGIVEELRSTGIDICDLGDLPFTPFSVDQTNPRSRNVEAVAATARAVKRQTAEILQHEAPFLFVGGDCTITVGIVAAFSNRSRNFGLLYIDGHTDLNRPETWYSGVMDGMGVAHMLGYGHESLLAVADTRPMLEPKQIAYLGIDPKKQYPAEAELLAKLSLVSIPVESVQQNAPDAFERARSTLAKFSHVIVHLDIDVLFFPEFPLAHVPDYRGAGLGLAELQVIIQRAFSMPNFAGFVVTEINPDRDKTDAYGRKIITLLGEAAGAA